MAVKSYPVPEFLPGRTLTNVALPLISPEGRKLTVPAAPSAENPALAREFLSSWRLVLSLKPLIIALVAP